MDVVDDVVDAFVVVAHGAVVVEVSGAYLRDANIRVAVAVSADLGAFEGVWVGFDRCDPCFDSDGFTEAQDEVVFDGASFESAVGVDEQVSFVVWSFRSDCVSDFEPVAECFFDSVVGDQRVFPAESDDEFVCFAVGEGDLVSVEVDVLGFYGDDLCWSADSHGLDHEDCAVHYPSLFFAGEVCDVFVEDTIAVSVDCVDVALAFYFGEGAEVALFEWWQLDFPVLVTEVGEQVVHCEEPSVVSVGFVSRIRPFYPLVEIFFCEFAWQGSDMCLKGDSYLAEDLLFVS